MPNSANIATIQPARPEDAAALTAIALASKAHWGYDAAFMAACAAELALTAEDIASHPTFTLRVGTQIAGFYLLALGQGDEVELDALFLAPGHIGAGLGRRLFEHARGTAATLGYRTMRIQADPHAAPFYEHMGATLVGTLPSGSIPGRMLPLFRLALP